MIPSARDEERLAVAIMAGEGLDYLRASDETKAAYRKAANSALIFLALVKTMGGGTITRPDLHHLSDRLEAFVTTLRETAAVMDADGGKTFAESLIKAAYANATEAETISRVLRGVAPEEITETSSAPKALSPESAPEEIGPEEEEAVG